MRRIFCHALPGGNHIRDWKSIMLVGDLHHAFIEFCSRHRSLCARNGLDISPP
jgi:hypothetical protein